MSLQMQSADNVEYVDESKNALKRLFLIATETLRDVNLCVNKNKTGFTRIYLLDIHNLSKK